MGHPSTKSTACYGVDAVVIDCIWCNNYVFIPIIAAVLQRSESWSQLARKEIKLMRLVPINIILCAFPLIRILV